MAQYQGNPFYVQPPDDLGAEPPTGNLSLCPAPAQGVSLHPTVAKTLEDVAQ